MNNDYRTLNLRRQLFEEIRNMLSAKGRYDIPWNIIGFLQGKPVRQIDFGEEKMEPISKIFSRYKIQGETVSNLNESIPKWEGFKFHNRKTNQNEFYDIEFVWTLHHNQPYEGAKGTILTIFVSKLNTRSHPPKGAVAHCIEGE